MDRYVIKNQKQLRCGITTGTCAAAAAGAAAAHLLMGVGQDSVLVHTPKGITVQVPVVLSKAEKQKCEYMVVKDSGDDPDVTNHAEIFVSLEMLSQDTPVREKAFWTQDYPNLYLDGGAGIGRVTRKGLEQEIGQAAINVVPRNMIFQAVGEICRTVDFTGPLLIIVSVPDGAKLAARTFNARLGIEGGLSVLGTSGILEPMSEKAIIDTIEAQVRQLQAQGEKRLLVMPGNYGQSYAQKYLQLDLEGSVKCSNYIGETLDFAVSYGMEDFLLIGNVGKLVKLAAGIMNTHSQAADGRCEIFAAHAALCKGSSELVMRIMSCINTDEMLQELENQGLRAAVMESICNRISEYVGRRLGDKISFGVIMFSERFGFLGQTEGTEAVLQNYRKFVKE